MKDKITLQLLSYGLKSNKGDAGKGYRSIPIADFYIDCRGVPDDKNRVAGETLHETISACLALVGMEEQLLDSLDFLESRRSDEADPFARPYVVCFLCAHGMHRSVTCKKILGDWLSAAGWTVEVE